MTLMKPVRLLHVADLHGAKTIANTPNKWWEERIETQANVGFDALICSGDVGLGGNAETLNKGFEYLAKLCYLAKGRKKVPRLIVTPGNHDVNRPKLNANDEERTRIRFSNFLKAVNQSTLPYTIPALNRGDGIGQFAPTHAPYVAIVPICTTSVSGDIPQEYREKLDRYIKTKPKATREEVERIADEIFENTIRTDMPFVRTSDINALRAQCCDNRTALGKARLRIGVSHHPLWAVPPAESSFRGFDVVPNGMGVATLLEDMGFQLILHGHKHYMGCSLMGGLPYRYGTEIGRVGGLISVSGGHLFFPDVQEHFGFQTITITPGQSGIIEISIRAFTSATADGIEICCATINSCPVPDRKVRSPERHGARWMQICDSDAQLSYDTINRIGVPQLVKTVDERLNTRHALSEGDRFLAVAVKSISEFAKEGSRGVDKQFMDGITVRAKDDAQAMVFVDVGGGGTWGRPDLIENASSLFRIYIEKNHTLLNGIELGRGWKHRLHAIEEAVSEKLNKPCQQSQEPPSLAFDLARILVWEPEALYAPSAQVLLGLHKVFNVPLFFVDLTELGEMQNEVYDCHLEWIETCNKPNEGWRFDKNTGTRTKSSELAIERDWSKVRQLLSMAKDPFAVMGDTLKWLL